MVIGRSTYKASGLKGYWGWEVFLRESSWAVLKGNWRMLSVLVGGSTWLERIYGIPERFGILGEGASNRTEGMWESRCWRIMVEFSLVHRHRWNHQVLGFFFVERVFIADSISVLVIDLFKLSMFSCHKFGELYFSRNTFIYSIFSNLLTYSYLKQVLFFSIPMVSLAISLFISFLFF